MGSDLLIQSLIGRSIIHQKTSIKMLSLTLLLMLPFVSAECPEGWWRAGDVCYFTSQQQMTAFQATAFCWQPWQPGNRLGILAEFKDKAEESHVESFLNIDNAFWIGLNDIQGEGVFNWGHQGFDSLEYTNWLPGEPNDADPHKHCVFTRYQNGIGFGWNDADCEYGEYAYA